MKPRTYLAAALAAILTTAASAHPGVTRQWLDAVKQVESGGDCTLVGDGGKAIGPYQIHRGYWLDATAADRTIGGRYEDCVKPEYAERIVNAYMTRHAPKNATPEQLAKIHNGGPKAIKAKPGSRLKAAIDKYWRKVQDAMRPR